MTAVALPKLWLPKFEPWRLLRPLKMFDGQFRPSSGYPQFGGVHPPRNPWHRKTLIEILTTMGKTTNLMVCLDAADANSLPASSTKWLDVSGNSYDFDRGTDATSQSSDPTINGSAGGRSSAEYLSFDGGDRLQYEAANQTWMTELHYSTAVWTFMAWVYSAGYLGLNTPAQLFGTTGHGSQVERGVSLAAFGTTAYLPGGENALALCVCDASSTLPINAFIAGNGNGFVYNRWNFVSLSYNANISGGGNEWVKLRLNDFTYARTTAATTPFASSTASYTLELSGPTNFLPSGWRMAMAAFWIGSQFTAEEMAAIHTATRGRFGV